MVRHDDLMEAAAVHLASSSTGTKSQPKHGQGETRGVGRAAGGAEEREAPDAVAGGKGELHRDGASKAMTPLYVRREPRPTRLLCCPFPISQRSRTSRI